MQNPICPASEYHTASRGVATIAEATISSEELESHQVREIVTDIFQRKGLAAPYSIEFEPKPSVESKPRAYFEGESLRIIASTESELRRLIGRFVIERSWSPHEWFLANRLGLYILTCVVLLTTLPVIGFVLSWLIQEIRLLLLSLTIIGVAVFSLWTSHRVSFRNIQLVRKLTLEMVDLGCMTEYDGYDYEIDYHLTAIGALIICTWAGLVIGMLGLMFYQQASYLFMFVLILLVLPSVFVMFTTLSRSQKFDLCYEHHAWDEEESEEFGEFDDNDYLQTEFTDLIERMHLRSSLVKEHGSEFSKIRVGYSRTEFAQCRWTTNFVEEVTLRIVCRDVSEAAARRYGTAVLVKGTLPFYTDLSFKKRAVELIALFFGLIMMMPVLIISSVGSKELGIAILIFTAVIFSALSAMGMKQNNEVRRDLPVLLEKTGVYNEHELRYYSKRMFSLTSRFDWGLLIGFLVVFSIIGYLILVMS
jgi:hypothetical protein